MADSTPGDGDTAAAAKRGPLAPPSMEEDHVGQTISDSGLAVVLRSPHKDGTRGVRRLTLTSPVLAGALLIALLVLCSSAGAKEFKPGDLSVCGAARCVSINSRVVLNAIASFYYNPAQRPERARAPKLGAPFFRLKFSDGYVSGIVAGRRLARFLSYGVDLEQFQDGRWYRVPTPAVAGLRRLTIGLKPQPLTAAALTDAGALARRWPSAAPNPTPRARRPATASGHANSLLWLLGLVALTALAALALFARYRRRSVAASSP